MRRILPIFLLGLFLSGCGGNDGPTSPSPQASPTPTPTPTSTPQPTSISGAWAGTANSTQIVNARFNIAVNLTQTGTAVTGSFTCTPATGTNCAAPSATVDGTLNGTALAARVLLAGGVVACSSFNGTVSGTTMSGTYTCGSGSNIDAGSWSMTKQ